MAMGAFRKSLWGFNRDDVIKYIEEIHQKFARKEKEHTDKIELLSKQTEGFSEELERLTAANADYESRLNEANVRCGEQERENAELSRQAEKAKALQEQLTAAELSIQSMSVKLADFEAKREKIEALSEGIGRLYLVTQTNADAIFSSTRDKSQIVSEQAEKNIADMEAAEENLAKLRRHMADVFEKFNDDLVEMSRSLENTKMLVAQSDAELKSSTEEMERLLSGVSTEIGNARG